MLKIIKQFWQVNWAEQFQYRANTLMYLLYWLVSPVVYMSVWISIARTNGGVGGMQPADFSAYYLVMLAVNILVSEITLHILASKIEDGTLSGMLLLPIHPILSSTLMNNLAFKALQVIVVIPIMTLLVWLFEPNIQITLTNALLALPAIVMAFTMRFFLGAVLTFVAFWTTRVYALNNIYYAINSLFSGEFVPLVLLPAGLLGAANLLPFQLTLYFPTQILLGHVSATQIWRGYGLQLAWCLAFFTLFALLWRAGTKRYSAVGA